MSETDNNKNILEKMKNYAESIISIIALVSISLSGISYLSNYFYSIEAEEFYGIPYIYFINGVLGKNSMLIIATILNCIILSYPFIIKRIFKQKKIGLILAFFCSITICIDICYIMLLSLKFISYYWKMSIYEFLHIIIGVVYFFIYLGLFFIIDSKEKKETITDKEKKKQTNNSKKLYDIKSIIGIVILSLPFLSTIFISCNMIEIDPKDKREYEIVRCNENVKYGVAVIKHKDDKIILMNCKIEEGENNKQILILEKGKYYNKNKEDYTFEYIQFDKVKCE